MNTSDEDVERFLKILTLLEIDEIEKVIIKHNENKELRF